MCGNNGTSVRMPDQRIYSPNVNLGILSLRNKTYMPAAIAPIKVDPKMLLTVDPIIVDRVEK